MVGWALAGACPGPIMVQLGEGKLLAAATLAVVVESKVVGLDREVFTFAWPRPAGGLPEK